MSRTMIEPAVIPPAVGYQWERCFARRTGRMRASAIRELLKLTMQPDMISFAGGMPAPEMFPLDAFREASDTVLRSEGSQALQYGPTEGYLPLRQYIAGRMRRFGLAVNEENVLLTNGSQQALDLLGKVFVDQAAPVCIERPTYLGALQAWNAYEGRFRTVSQDQDGMVMDELAKALELDRPRFVYVLPNFQNPSGVSLSVERRRKLVELIAASDAFIVEDDPYGELRFEGEESVPIISLAPERTIYLSTFSKTLSPGIRLGWVIAPTEVIRKLILAKQGADLHTGTFVQMVAYEICRRGVLETHVPKIRETYRQRRDAMLKAMAEYFPNGVSWTRPRGGLFLWVTVPQGLDSGEMLKAAITKKVAYVPGDAFFPTGDDSGRHHLRLNFSYCPPQTITEGIRRLGRVLKEEIKK